MRTPSLEVVLVNKKRYIGIQVDGKVIIRKWKVRKDIDPSSWVLPNIISRVNIIIEFRDNLVLKFVNNV